jgi:hypothetical protein
MPAIRLIPTLADDNDVIPFSAVLRRSRAGTKRKVSIIRFVAAGRAFAAVTVFGVAGALQNNNSRLKNDAKKRKKRAIL